MTAYLETEKTRLLDWQRKLDPSNFNKATGVQYRVAPTVILPGAPEYPDNPVENSVTILFYIDSSCWVTPLQEKIEIVKPIFVEKEPQKRAKNGPVILMDETNVYAAIPVNEGSYWSAQIMTREEYEPLSAYFVPGKVNQNTGKSKIKCIVTFLPK